MGVPMNTNHIPMCFMGALIKKGGSEVDSERFDE